MTSLSPIACTPSSVQLASVEWRARQNQLRRLPQTHVYSESATFDTKAGLIIYREHIRVVDPQLHLTSAILTVQLTQGGAPNQLDHIVAETNVIMDFIDEKGQKTHATSEKAVYTRLTDPATNELLTLSGNPRLETTNGWATADVFVMNRTTGKIHGSGNCHFFHHEDPAPAGGDATNNRRWCARNAGNGDYGGQFRFL